MLYILVDFVKDLTGAQLVFRADFLVWPVRRLKTSQPRVEVLRTFRRWVAQHYLKETIFVGFVDDAVYLSRRIIDHVPLV